MDAAAWKSLSPYLDQVLALDEGDRPGWIASLKRDHPSIAAELEALLDEHRALSAQAFLEGAMVRPRRGGPSAGQSVGTYTLLAPIGEGGMGTVWLADRSDGRFERRAAIKFLHVALGERGEERFRREGRMLARLAHPNIAQLVDAGVTEAGAPYLVLEYVDGERIDRYCASRGLNAPARIALALDVLAAVAHAHANLIVHRDIKPSNVLVTADGAVKLLDFGIGKLVDDDEAVGLTREGGVLTPAYAAPEQLTGGDISTATDVYAAGVLLYELLTGKHPAGDSLTTPATLVRAIVDEEPSHFPRGDLGTILRKALKKRPAERYPSAAALADDLRHYLRREPIAARPDTLRYRAVRFVQRHYWPVAAAIVVVVGLVAGLYVINRERTIAERRFQQVRELANKLFEVDVQVRPLPGSTRTRQYLVDTSLSYLRALTADVDVRRDPGLALELGTAYMRVGRVQGVPITTNLGQPEQAEASLRAAEALVRDVLAAAPGNRDAMIRAAQIAHDRMVLAQARRPDTEALPLARESQAWLDRYLASGPIAPEDAEAVVITGQNVANWYGQKDLVDEGATLLRRIADIAVATNQPRQAGATQIVTARMLRASGNLDGALAAIQSGVALIQPEAESALGQHRTYALALTTEAEVLGQDEAVSLGRPDQAIPLLERAYALMSDAVERDPNETQSRFMATTTLRTFAAIVRHRDPDRALQFYERALTLSRQIANNARARRDEVSAHAGAARTLTAMARFGEARRHLARAFEQLAMLKLYPAASISAGSEAYFALRARAELEAASGDPARAADTLTGLLDAVMASDAKPDTNLLDAFDVALIHSDLATVHRRAGREDLATAANARRRDLWSQWQRRLPANPFVQRQLAAID